MVRMSAYIPGTFWDYVDTAGDCWQWTGAVSGGYGRTRVDGRQYQAHRVTYAHFIGPIPEGHHVDHLCRNQLCVRPSHLEAVTPQMNVRRGTSIPANNARKTHCSRGHPFTPENTYLSKRGRQCRTCYLASRSAEKKAKRRANIRRVECGWCGAPFEYWGHMRLYCSNECGAARRRWANRERCRTKYRQATSG